MQVTQESARARWLIMSATWLVCAALVISHARAVRSYLEMIDAAGRRNGTEVVTPMRHVVPSRFADAQMWVRHAIDAQANGSLRVRSTLADNAPHGREVHWASPLLWLILLVDKVTDIENALLWINVPLLLGLLVLMSGWVAARVGAAGGVLVAFSMLGHNRFYDAFAPANVDHHGLLIVAVLGLVLGAIFMGAGWWKPNLGGTFTTLLPSDPGRARRAAVISAVSGAVGVWISAASVLPVIAILGAAGLCLAFWRGPEAQRDGARFDPGLWRLWGRVGAALSVLFYLIEYAPHHLGLRLEVNHPLYALGWWGGAEIVARISAWRVDGARSGARRHVLLRLVLPVLAVLVVPVVIIKGGERVFALSDPFIGELRHFVIEGQSLPEAARRLGYGAIVYQLASCLLLVAAIAVGWRSRGERATLLTFASLLAFAFVLLGFWEVRWWAIGSATQIALLLVLLAMTRHPWRWTAVLWLAVLLPGFAQRIFAMHAAVKNGVIEARDVTQPLYRDIAAALRASQPEGDITLLASPNASLGVGYYGHFNTLGTLFWENAAGLKAAATILTASSDAEAAALIRGRGVTHIALVSSELFLAEYERLLHGAPDAAAVKRSLGYRLAFAPPEIPWLQPIPYRPPADLPLGETKVRLYKVAFEQTEIERLYHHTVALAASGDSAQADAALADALARIPADGRFTFAESIGAALYELNLDAAAVRAFRRALEFNPDPNVTATLAWILASSSDAACRDARTALALMEPLTSQSTNDPIILNIVAAALAELGRFPEAVTAGEQALAAAKAAGDDVGARLLQQRLDSYRANRPLRQ